MTDLSGSILPALTELERAYLAFVKQLPAEFSAPLLATPPVITIQSRGRKKFLGWCQPKSWQQQQGGPAGGLNEIAIAAEELARPPAEVLETLFHEAAHHLNALNGVKDCSGNQYHSRKFRDMAEHFGLLVEKMPKYGYAGTKLGPGLEKLVASIAPNADAFSLARKVLSGKPTASTKMKKWTCSCGINVRAAVVIDVTCNQCGGVFQKEERDHEQEDGGEED